MEKKVYKGAKKALFVFSGFFGTWVLVDFGRFWVFFERGHKSRKLAFLEYIDGLKRGESVLFYLRFGAP